MSNNKPGKPSPVQPAVTGDDLRHINDSHGIMPIATTHPNEDAGHLLPTIYAAWVESQGLDPSRSYAMPVHLLTGHVRRHFCEAEDRWALDHEVRALVVNELNSPDSGFVIVPRPHRAKRAA